MKPTSAIAKGKSFERELARDIEERLGGRAYRSPCSGAMWHNKADVNCCHNIMTRFHIEAKHQKQPRVEAAYAQALRGAGTDKIPLAVVKRDRDIPMVYLRWVDLLSILAEFQESQKKGGRREKG